MNMDKISNDSVVNEIINRITDSLKNEELKPGDKIPTEVELMESLGVGRNSVREAIKMLSAMGVLEVRRGSGTFVATKVSAAIFNPLVFSLILEPKSNEDLYELRVMYDGMVLLIALEKATDEDINNIEYIINKAKDLLLNKQGTIHDFVQLDVDFHLEILKSTHNHLIEHIGKTIVELFPKYIEKSLSQKNGIKRSINNHEALLDIIKNRCKTSALETNERTLAEWKNKWMEEE